MLKKIAFCGLLIAVIIGPALAQPAPAPKLGTRAYTEAALQTFEKARAAYNDQCNTGTSLAVMDAAWSAIDSTSAEAMDALFKEVDNQPSVMAAQDNYKHLNNAYESLAKSQKDYEAELKAKSAMQKALAALNSVRSKAQKDVVNGLNASGFNPLRVFALSGPCPKHQALIDAKKKADEAAKVASSKPVPKTATGTAKPADDCNKGGGLSGIMEGVACQEGK